MPRSPCRKPCRQKREIVPFTFGKYNLSHSLGEQLTRLAFSLSGVPLPFLLQPFLPTKAGPCQLCGRSPSLLPSSLLFASLHQRRELTDLLHSLALKPSTGTSDQISINYDRVLHLLATPEGAIDLRSVRTTSVKSQPPRYVLLSRGCAVAGNVRGVPENLAPTDIQW